MVFAHLTAVAPFVGAWIEIGEVQSIKLGFSVAPFVGAWIEIVNKHRWSHINVVAPFVGAWIEICGIPTTT